MVGMSARCRRVGCARGVLLAIAGLVGVARAGVLARLSPLLLMMARSVATVRSVRLVIGGGVVVMSCWLVRMVVKP